MGGAPCYRNDNETILMMPQTHQSAGGAVKKTRRKEKAKVRNKEHGQQNRLSCNSHNVYREEKKSMIA